MKSNRVYVEHILTSISDIESFTQSGRDGFEQSKLIQAGVIRNLEVLGEATKRISSDLKSWYPEVPWKQMAALRDVLIHDYMGVDLNIVWNVVENELPRLKHQLTAILIDIGTSDL